MDTSEKLIQEIEAKRTSFRTENYSMSIGELANLYKNKEINIRPEYQRLFRWTQGQKVKLIESILLGIPIPSIFVFQDTDGKWELVDGLQRVSTILQFLGELDGEEPLQLNGTKYLPSLEGFCWEDKEKEIPANIKLSFRRAKINLTIILSDSDPRAKFEVFQRLNTGGSNASNQEIRNNVMLMLNPDIYNWFYQLSENEDYQTTLALSERLYTEQYHMELLLRYIALLYFPYDNKKDIGDYLNDVNELLLTDKEFHFNKAQEQFTKTFKFLNTILNDKSFKKFDGRDFKGRFLESAFESVAIGLGFNIEQYNLDTDKEIIIDKIKELYSQPIYTETSGSGSSSKSRIPKLVPFAKEYFKK